jgi:hypothetical protein
MLSESLKRKRSVVALLAVAVIGIGCWPASASREAVSGRFAAADVSQRVQTNANTAAEGIEATRKDAVSEPVVPLPERTAFDDSPLLRASYLENYRDGYLSGLRGDLSIREYINEGRITSAIRNGFANGQSAGLKEYSLRLQLEIKQRQTQYQEDEKEIQRRRSPAVFKPTTPRPNVWDPNVQDLLRPDRRETAYAELLRQGRYATKPRYMELHAKPIAEVVLCPQGTNLPMVAVFDREAREQKRDLPARSGHLVLFTADGIIVPVYFGANSVKGSFEDINGDGIIDWVDSFLIGFGNRTFAMLHVTPITPAQRPTLQVLYDDDKLVWRCAPVDSGPARKVQLRQKQTFELAAEYLWSPTSRRWEGPEGGGELGFVRVHNEDLDAAAAMLH